jgi:methyltransferase
MSILYIVAALVALQRIVELIYAERNTRALRIAGAQEYASWQHPLFVLLHAAWLVAMLVLIPSAQAPNWYLLALFFVLQALRVWVIASLGPFWTTRIISLAGAPIVRRGPYRWMRHPNYAIVIAEIAVLPLAFRAPAIALVFSILNAGLLTLRIRAEEDALAPRYSQ